MLVGPTALPAATDDHLTGNAATPGRAFLRDGPRAVSQAVLETVRAEIC